jgi:hypothetical protein
MSWPTEIPFKKPALDLHRHYMTGVDKHLRAKLTEAMKAMWGN